MVSKPNRDFTHAANPGIQLGRDIILLPFGRNDYLPELVRQLNAVGVPLDASTDRELYRFETDNGAAHIMFGGMGGPTTVNALEMIKANGGRRVYLFGACGGVSQNLKVGDLLVAGGAVRWEGASRHYASLEYPAICDPLLTGELYETACTISERVQLGLVHTTDASYRQGPEIYEPQMPSVLGVECECASAAVAGQVLGLRITALFFCSDSVVSSDVDDHSYRGLSNPVTREAFSRGVEILKTCVNKHD